MAVALQQSSVDLIQTLWASNFGVTTHTQIKTLERWVLRRCGPRRTRFFEWLGRWYCASMRVLKEWSRSLAEEGFQSDAHRSADPLHCYMLQSLLHYTTYLDDL